MTFWQNNVIRFAFQNVSLVVDESREGQRLGRLPVCKKGSGLKPEPKKRKIHFRKELRTRQSASCKERASKQGGMKIRECVSGTTTRSTRVNRKRGRKNQGGRIKNLPFVKLQEKKNRDTYKDRKKKLKKYLIAFYYFSGRH